MSTANQETLAESGASDRPLILEKGSYVPWASRFLRFIDNKRNEGEWMRHSIDKVIDYENDYQWEIQGDVQEDKLTTAMMLLARAITQRYSTPTNNRLHTSSNTRNKAVIQDGRVDIQSKNAGYARNGNRNAGRTNRNQATNAENDNAYGDNTLEELNAAVIMMARIQPTDDKSDAEPTYDAESHEKLKTVIHTSVDEQIDSDIIFDDPYVEDNSGQDEHDSNAHDRPYADIESLINNVQVEAEKQQKMNIELQKQKSVATKGTLFCDPYMQTGLGYQNPERLKKAIEAQPKMYDGEKLESNKLKVDLPDYKETLEDAKKVD
ncbi:hypothetical protein Tco_1166878 [Tanacetum coccineum]